MSKILDTKNFWEERLAKGTDLRVTGHWAFTNEYNRWLYQAQLDVIEKVLLDNRIDLAGRSYLDVGSGGGFFIDYLSKKGCSPIYGLDITEKSVTHLKQLFPIYSFFRTDISEKELPLDRNFTLITAMSVLYHIVDDAKFVQAISNLCSLLEPQGYLFLCDTFKRPWLPQPPHVKLRDVSSYLPILEQNSVKLIGLIPLYYFLNQVFIPRIGPLIINHLNLGLPFYSIDTYLRKHKISNGHGVKLLVAQKKC